MHRWSLYRWCLARQRLFIFQVAILAVLSAAGCATTPRTVPLGGTVARAGIEVSEAAIDEYKRLDELAEIAVERNLVGTVVALPPASKIVPKPGEPDRFGEALDQRRDAFQALGEAYESFNRLSDTAFASDTEAAAVKLTGAAAALAGAAEAPLPGEQALGRLPGLAGFAVEKIQAGRIKEQNEALSKLASSARELWDHDLPVFERYIDTVYDGLPAIVADLPASAFDMAAVSSAVADPYPPEVKLRLYKLRQYRDAASAKIQEKQRLADVSRALAALESAHVELQKDQPSPSDVLGDVRRIGELVRQ